MHGVVSIRLQCILLIFFSIKQTVELKNQDQQCSKNASTQMTKIGCYVSNMEDKLITPGTYITAGEYHSKRLRAVRVFGGVERELCSFCAFTVHDKCLYVCMFSSGHYTTVVRQALASQVFHRQLETG